ncbi:MAG: manganese efflux pump [Bacteroidia bacterium]|nr:manganese efflux pump [Bacteroidia bacterium]
MSLFELILIALGLSMDCFAVAVGLCICQRLSWHAILKMALFFGLFQALMPVLGWLVGVSLKELISEVDHWIAFGLLAIIGGKMILQSFRSQQDKLIHTLTLPVLITLSVATSIDALITGLSFGFIDVNIITAGIIIFVITFLVTIAGAKLGEKTTFLPARWAERFGGIVLILIGVKIVLDHLGIVNW